MRVKIGFMICLLLALPISLSYAGSQQKQTIPAIEMPMGTFGLAALPPIVGPGGDGNIIIIMGDN